MLMGKSFRAQSLTIFRIPRGSPEKWQNFGKESDNLCDDDDKDEPVDCWITVFRVPCCVRFYQFPPQNGRSGLGRFANIL